VDPSHCGKYISLAEWSYNTSIHSATGTSPFQITFGKPPPSIPFYLTVSSSVEAVNSLLTSRQVLLDQLRTKFEKAQLTMKEITDRHCRDVAFQVDDWVYVRLRPYMSTISSFFYNPEVDQALLRSHPHRCSHCPCRLSTRSFSEFKNSPCVSLLSFEAAQGPTSYYSYWFTATSTS
ncbi:hypothetical protein V8G54_022910, partial [Vigna mungo]